MPCLFWMSAPPKFCSAPRPSRGRRFLAPRAPSAPAPLPTLVNISLGQYSRSNRQQRGYRNFILSNSLNSDWLAAVCQVLPSTTGSLKHTSVTTHTCQANLKQCSGHCWWQNAISRSSCSHWACSCANGPTQRWMVCHTCQECRSWACEI